MKTIRILSVKEFVSIFKKIIKWAPTFLNNKFIGKT
jgi:hypothetical protein